MTERERLIELIDKAGGVATHHFFDDIKLCPNPVERIAEHLLANGVIVPPCKVGDRIYYLDKYSGEVEEDTVKFFTVTKNGVRPILERHNTKFWDFYKWGKTVFPTKKEAEQALKGGEQE